MKYRSSRFVAGLLLLLLAGCSGVQLQLPPAGPTETAIGEINASVMEPSPTPTVYKGLCSYVWASQALPELKVEINGAFRQAGMPEVESEVSAYGEMCVDMGTNAAIHFTPQQTDFVFYVSVDDATDTRVMGDWIVKIVEVVEAFDPASFPGERPGKMEVGFEDGSQLKALTFNLEQAQKLTQQGLNGSRLFEALDQ